MGEDITLKAEDGFEIDAYLALPSGTPKGAVVVIQEIFGVNAHIREARRHLRQGGLCRELRRACLIVCKKMLIGPMTQMALRPVAGLP